MTHTIQLPRGLIIALLSLAYMFGFLVSPYWILNESILADILFLSITIVVGVVWVFVSANSVCVRVRWRDTGLFLLLFVAAFVINYRPLNAVIPFRGDEGLHIERTLAVMDRIPFPESLVLAVLCIAFIVSALYKKYGWTIVIGIAIMIGVAGFFLGKSAFDDMEQHPQFFLRYPFINYWFFAFAPKLAARITSPYHEILYRVVPFLGMVATAWVFQTKARVPTIPGSLAWGFAVATIPLVLYYSSIQYLEPPAVLLMTIVCLEIGSLLYVSSEEISRIPAWYALILVGFIKETTLPFLLCALALRAFVQVRAWQRTTPKENWGRLLRGELGILFSVLAPAFLYLYFRASLTSTRSFIPHLENLADLSIYSSFLLSFLDQFGPFLLFFIAGCILLARGRQWAPLLAYLSIIVAIFIFHALDEKAYVGYSRFNLFVLPPFLAGSLSFVAWLAKQKPYLASIAVLFAIAGNVLLSPANLDGSKVPYWGDRRGDTSEHYYPYQDALLWLKNNYPEKRVLFTGLDFYYPFEFYWNKLGWKPRRDGIPSEPAANETTAIANMLRKAEEERYSAIVYRVIHEDLLIPQETGDFRLKVIRNSAHTLLIFYEP
jgi:hypothetical protein